MVFSRLRGFVSEDFLLIEVIRALLLLLVLLHFAFFRSLVEVWVVVVRIWRLIIGRHVSRIRIGVHGIVHLHRHHRLHGLHPVVTRGFPAVLHAVGVLVGAFCVGKVSAFEDDLLVEQQRDFHSFVAQGVLALVQLLLCPDRVFEAVESEQKIGPVLAVAVPTHVLTHYLPVLLADRLDDLHLHSGGGDGGKPEEKNGQGRTLPVVFVVVADNIGSSRRIRKENPKAGWIPEPHDYLLRFFEGSGGLAGLLELHKSKFGKDLHLLHYAEVRHYLHHLLPLEILRNATQPQLPHQNPTRLFTDDSFRCLHRHANGILRVLHGGRMVGRVRIALNGLWIRRVSHLGRVRHLRGERFYVSLHSCAVSIIFDVHFPRGVPFLQCPYDVVGEGLVALHRDEGVAKEVEPSASVISLDDPAYVGKYLTSLSSARG